MTRNHAQINMERLTKEVRAKLHEELNALTTQREIAARVGVRPDTMTRIIKGQIKNPNFQTVARLAKWIDCPMEFFVTG